MTIAGRAKAPLFGDRGQRVTAGGCDPIRHFLLGGGIFQGKTIQDVRFHSIIVGRLAVGGKGVVGKITNRRGPFYFMKMVQY